MKKFSTKEMRSGFLPDRIIHLHPTRKCNLSCLHCYSESAPQQKSALDLDLLKTCLVLLRTEGYSQISISGGEPLTYKPLIPLIDYAHSIGFRVTMITNGLFSKNHIDKAVSQLDGVAVSFDGLAPIHNHLRDRSDAFENASKTLARLADKGLPVSAAISLIPDAIPDLPDLADHLVNLGAKILQVRPVAIAGRARMMMNRIDYSSIDQARLYLVVLALQEELGDQVRVQCDLAPAQILWQQRSDYSALLAECMVDSKPQQLADLINPLVITEIGVLKPIAYDFNPRFNISSIQTLSDEELSYYKKNKLDDFKMLIGNALSRLKDFEGLIDWFDYCTRMSERNIPEQNQGLNCDQNNFMSDLQNVSFSKNEVR